VDQLRLDLQTVRNELRMAATALEQERSAAARAMEPRVAVPHDREILTVAARLCAAAGVPAPTTLEEAIQPEWAASLAVGVKTDSAAIRVADLASGLQALSLGSADVGSVEKWNTVLASQATKERKTNELFRAADSLLADESSVVSCPLCGQQVDEGLLRSQIKTVLEDLRQSAEELSVAMKKSPLVASSESPLVAR
jgi:hypothetical protein